MAEALILEFEGVGRAEYDAVNDLLGIDMGSGDGDRPPGLWVHTAGATENGWAVFEGLRLIAPRAADSHIRC